jgi:crotonobetainyl-CoA:carnitine CoA-transferase CaiB-like acyl-CoA transferase
MLGLQNEREWVVFCDQVLGQPALATDERFVSNSKRAAARGALRELIVEAFAPFTAAQVIARLDAAGIANAQMNDMHDVWAHPQLAARKRWVEVDTSAGPVLAPLPPGVARGTSAENAPRMDSVPALGQHTDAILGELGYDGAAIAALRAAKAV